MERIDLGEPRFAQADVVQLVPGLTPRTLQNWAERLLEFDEPNPGRGAQRFYTAFAIVVLRFMQALVELGVPPSAARDMAAEVSDAVVDLHRTYPAKEEPDRLHWPINAKTAHKLRRAYIFKSKKGEYAARIEHGDLSNIALTVSPTAYITVQVDVLSLEAFNAIYAFIAANPEQKK